MKDWIELRTVPHPDREWRAFGERTMRHMARHGLRAPWNHREIWFWVASTADGCAWLEREIRFWHQRMNEHDAASSKTRRRMPLFNLKDPVEYVDDYEAALPFSDQLHAREKRDKIDNRFRDGW